MHRNNIAFDVKLVLMRTDCIYFQTNLVVFFLWEKLQLLLLLGQNGMLSNFIILCNVIFTYFNFHHVMLIVQFKKMLLLMNLRKKLLFLNTYIKKIKTVKSFLLITSQHQITKMESNPSQWISHSKQLRQCPLYWYNGFHSSLWKTT